MLAALLLRANRTVGVGELISLLWTEEPPADARATVQTYATGLRRLLTVAAGRSLPHTRDCGYQLEVAHGALDRDRFEALAANPAPLRSVRTGVSRSVH